MVVFYKFLNLICCCFDFKDFYINSSNVINNVQVANSTVDSNIVSSHFILNTRISVDESVQGKQVGSENIHNISNRLGFDKHQTVDKLITSPRRMTPASFVLLMYTTS